MESALAGALKPPTLSRMASNSCSSTSSSDDGAPGIARRPSIDDELKQPRIPGKTVYVLGSGFSVALGIPMIRDFVPLGLELLKKENRQRKGEDGFDWDARSKFIAKVIEITNRYRRTLMGAVDHEPHIEDMFSLADLLGEMLPVEGGRSAKVRDMLAAFLRIVCLWTYGLHESGETPACVVPRSHFMTKRYRMPEIEPSRGSVPADSVSGVCLYEAFLSQVLSDMEPQTAAASEAIKEQGYAGPAIISLNYDLVVEKKLERLQAKSDGEKHPRHFLGRGVDCCHPTFVRARHWLPLIKLHGSADWKRNPGQHPGSLNDCIQTSDKPSLDWKLNEEPMVFPTWQRDSLEGTVFAKLLDEARIHLRLASRIVFIGYSLPETDLYIRYLLADALDTVELPAIETANQFKTLEEARSHVARVMGPRAARQLKENYPEGLKGFVQFHTDKSSFHPAP